jgi:hypothetical protein
MFSSHENFVQQNIAIQRGQMDNCAKEKARVSEHGLLSSNSPYYSTNISYRLFII